MVACAARRPHLENTWRPSHAHQATTAIRPVRLRMIWPNKAPMVGIPGPGAVRQHVQPDPGHQEREVAREGDDVAAHRRARYQPKASQAKSTADLPGAAARTGLAKKLSVGWA